MYRHGRVQTLSSPRPRKRQKQAVLSLSLPESNLMRSKLLDLEKAWMTKMHINIKLFAYIQDLLVEAII